MDVEAGIAAAARERANARRLWRYQNEPEFAERWRVRQRAYCRRKRADPDYRERENERQRERYQNDPEWREHRRAQGRAAQRRWRERQAGNGS